MWVVGFPYKKMPLFVVSSHDWHGTVPQLSFGLYQLIWELKLLTRSRWRKKTRDTIGKKKILIGEFCWKPTLSSYLSYSIIRNLHFTLLFSDAENHSPISWNRIRYYWISRMLKMLLQLLSLSKMIKYSITSALNCEFFYFEAKPWEHSCFCRLIQCGYGERFLFWGKNDCFWVIAQQLSFVN